MADRNVIWEDSALKLLETRDRYTRNAIREEFRNHPEQDAIEIDPAEGSFLTPVSNNRFSVIWRRSGELVVVRAVVPLTNLDALKTLAASGKKAYIGDVVARESKGEINL
jgi:hypothetical protein